VRERPRRHSHCHSQKKVLFFEPFLNLSGNGLEGFSWFTFVILYTLQFRMMSLTLIHCVDYIRRQRVRPQSAIVVTHVRWRCRVTARHCGSGSGCVIISLTILNRVIRRYRMTDYVIKSKLM
jgi:hypothetical protein